MTSIKLPLARPFARVRYGTKASTKFAELCESRYNQAERGKTYARRCWGRAHERTKQSITWVNVILYHVYHFFIQYHKYSFYYFTRSLSLASLVRNSTVNKYTVVCCKGSSQNVTLAGRQTNRQIHGGHHPPPPACALSYRQLTTGGIFEDKDAKADQQQLGVAIWRVGYGSGQTRGLLL